MASSRVNNTRSGLLWTSPWLIGLCIFLLAPLAMSLYYSLTDYPLLKPPVYVGLDNYRALLQDNRFWLVVRNTALYCAIAIPICTLVSLALAAMLATPGPPHGTRGVVAHGPGRPRGVASRDSASGMR